MDPVKIGLVGYGFGGRYFHAPLLAAAPECELVGVVTTSAERRDLVSAEHPGVDVFDSLAALAAAGAEAVSISTPAETHSALTDEAIELGLSVVCDKPFSLDPAAARRSVALAASRGVTLSPYQNRRWDSDFLTVRALVDDGTLGEVRRFESRFERYAPQNGPGRSGGGTLLDFGAHLVDQALTLLGPVESVYAESRTSRQRARRRRVRRAAARATARSRTCGAAGASTPPGHASGSRAPPPRWSSRRRTPRRTC